MRRFLALLAVAAVFLGACNNDDGGGGGGEAPEDPKAELTAAFEQFEPGQPATVTVSLVSTPEDLASLPDGPTEEQAETVLNSSISVSSNGAEEVQDAQARIAVNIDGTNGAEVIILEGDLYLRADVGGIAETFGADTADLEAGASAAEQQGLDFVRPLLEGEFIQFSGLQELLEGQTGADLGSLTKQQQQLTSQLLSALEEDAEVTFEGSDDVGDHYVATAPLRDLYETFLEFSTQSGQAIPPGMLPPTSEIPEGNLSLDMWVTEGRLSQIEFDFLQVAQFEEEAAEELEGVDQFALRITISEEFEEISAPDAAAEVTPEDIEALMGQLLFGGMPGAIPGGGAGGGGGGGGGVPGGGDPCSIYEGLPPEAFEGLPQETLDLLEAQCPGVVPN